MKKLEEDILKRFLQDTFSDYEPEPSDLSWEHIRKEIQPQQPTAGMGFRRWTIPVVTLLLLIGSIVWYEINTDNITALAVNTTKEDVKNNLQITDYQKINVKESTKQNTNERRQKLYVNKTTLTMESIVFPEINKSSEKSFISPILTKSPTLTNSLTNQNIRDKYVTAKVFIDKGVRRVVGKGTDHNVNQENDYNVNKNTENDREKKSLAAVSVPTDYSAKKSINHTLFNDAVVQEVRYIKSLEILKNKDLVLVKNPLMLPKISEINVKREAKPIRRPLYLSVSFTPLQTYRILRVNDQNIQNLQVNNLFDAERNGWAFDLGIIKPMGNKWNLRSNVSYLKMRQWAEYQINTNRIAVKNSSSNSTIAGAVNNDNAFIGQTRTEEKTLQMVGLKIDVQKIFKITERNRYFISGGSQLMIDPSEKQTNVFISASAGFQHLANKDFFVTIEPTASYLLNNINDSKSLIQTNAYNLGLKVGLSFRVK